MLWKNGWSSSSHHTKPLPKWMLSEKLSSIHPCRKMHGKHDIQACYPSSSDNLCLPLLSDSYSMLTGYWAVASLVGRTAGRACSREPFSASRSVKWTVPPRLGTIQMLESCRGAKHTAVVFVLNDHWMRQPFRRRSDQRHFFRTARIFGPMHHLSYVL